MVKNFRAGIASVEGGFDVGEEGYSYNSVAGVVSWFKEKPYASDYAEANQLRDSQALSKIFTEGKGVIIPNGTPLVVLEVDGSLRRVMVPSYYTTSGLNGSSGWVSVSFISKTFSF